jgi:hypothetical protein
MVETFYKIEVSKEKYTESAEYYTLALVHLTGSFFIVTEHHGWWDNAANKARLKTTYPNQRRRTYTRRGSKAHIQ